MSSYSTSFMKPIEENSSKNPKAERGIIPTVEPSTDEGVNEQISRR